MKWNGKKLLTLGDLNSAISSIVETGTRQDAERFMKEYRAESLDADSNVGYMSGYFDLETMRKIQDWFGEAR